MVALKEASSESRIANANKAFNQSGGGSVFELDALIPPTG